MRKLIIGLVVLALLALGVWLALRAIVDVERHQESLRAALESATGWSASFSSVHLSLARGVKLEMRDLSLIDRRGGSAIEAPRAIFRARLADLLRGRLALRDAALLRPQIVIARDPARGWRWPQPGRAAPGAPELAELTIRGGQLSLVGPAVSRTLEVSDLSAVLTPATGRLWGTALMASGSGRVKWLGRLGEGVEITIEGAEATALASWLPPDARPSGVVDLALRTDASGTRCEGRLDAGELTLFPELGALQDVGIEFSVAADEGAWRLDAAQIETGAVVARAEGWLAPLDARVVVEDVSLRDALVAGRALGRWDQPAVEDEGEGRLSATLHLGAEGPLRWWWSDLTIRGARVTRGDGGPALQGAVLELERERRDAEITGRVRGSLAGGSLVATIRVPGAERIEMQGGLRDARARALLGAGGPDARVTLGGRATLARGAGSGTALVAGELRLEGSGWDDPAWELSPLLVAACPPVPLLESSPLQLGDEPPEPPPEPPDPPGGLPLSWSARLDLASGELRELQGGGAAWEFAGEGSFSSSTGSLDLALRLAPRDAARQAFRASCGAGLARGDADPWPLRLGVGGTLSAPLFSSEDPADVRAQDQPLESAP